MFSVSIKVSVCERVACYRVWTCGVLPFVNVWRVTVCERVACYRVWTCGVLPFVNVWRVTVCERVACYRLWTCGVLPCVNVSRVTVWRVACYRVTCYRVWTCHVLPCVNVWHVTVCERVTCWTAVTVIVTSTTCFLLFALRDYIQIWEVWSTFQRKNKITHAVEKPYV